MASCGGGSAIIVVFVSSILVLLVLPCFSHPLCSDSSMSHLLKHVYLSQIYILSSPWLAIVFTGAPFSSKTPLLFCPYNGSLCCTSAQDLSLQKQFAAMNISHTECASLVKSVLCAVSSYFLWYYLSFPSSLNSFILVSIISEMWQIFSRLVYCPIYFSTSSITLQHYHRIK